MIFLLSCKHEEDPIKSEGTRVLTTLDIIFRMLKAANSVVGGEMWPKSKLISAFMVVLVTCKNEEVPIKPCEPSAQVS